MTIHDEETEAAEVTMRDARDAEVVVRDAVGGDAAVRDTAVRDAVGGDAAVRDAVAGDAAVRDAVAGDAAVRDAVAGDAHALLKIYDYYVRHTAVSFDWETPSLEEFLGRMNRIQAHYPYLVVLDHGTIAGYAYGQPFVGRKAYNWTCELTIYLDAQRRHRGLGRLLYEALEQRLCAMGILDLYACIGVPHIEREAEAAGDPCSSCGLDGASDVDHQTVRTAVDPHLSWDSPQFHERLGFRKTGHFEKCGYKFGRWYDMIWMGKTIGPHLDQQPPVIWYPQLKAQGYY